MTPGTPASDAPQRERPAAGPTPLPQLTLNENERRVVLAALPELSQREREVFFAICEGGRNQDIAKRLHIASPTLRTHLTRLNHKLDTTSKADLIRLAAAVLLGRYRAAHAAERLAQDPHSTPRQRGDL
jgi:DNA-binding CsgD family transcriptional regulator